MIDFVLPRGRGATRLSQLQRFAEYILNIAKKVEFKLSSRGWCYQLESYNVINKGQFNRVQKLINECRKIGLLPIDFVAEDDSRKFHVNVLITEDPPEKRVAAHLEILLNEHEYHHPDYFQDEEYYPLILVEKIDLVSLFKPICKTFKIHVTSGRGWSSILQRAEIAWKFKTMEEKYGCKPVLLYYGDHDPFGLKISDQFIKNLKDIELGTGWNPEKLVYLENGEEKQGIDRFGLNYDFIMEHNLTWIDNLISGTGRKPDYNNPIVVEYIKQFGERKVEANAVVVKPREAQNHCAKTIMKYLGRDVFERRKRIREDIKQMYEELMEETGIMRPIREALDLLNEYRGETIE